MNPTDRELVLQELEQSLDRGGYFEIAFTFRGGRLVFSRVEQTTRFDDPKQLKGGTRA